VSRLDREEVFSVPLDEADQYFPRNQAPDGLSADYHTRSGFPRIRASSIRAAHPDHSAAAPLDGRETELIDALTHPHVLEALRQLRKIQHEVENAAPSVNQSVASLRSTEERLKREVEERKEKIGALEQRILDGQTLDAAQLGLLTDRTEEIDPKTEQITALNGDVLYADTSYVLGTMNEGFGSSALWSPVHSQRLFHELPKRLLRTTARKMGERPPERSVAQHIDRLGVERVMEADEHFGVDESTETKKKTRTPRRKRTPSTSL
jgi:hypothetical protein